jgi:hypothetical protein
MKPRTLLKTLLVLSYIGSGMMFLSCFFTVAFKPYYEQLLAAEPSPLPEVMKLSVERALALPQGFYVASGLLYALSLIGVTLMWKLHRAGFHCYTMAQLLLLLLPLLFFGKGNVNLGDVMLTALFVFYYYRLMKLLAEPREETPADPSDPTNLTD